MKQNYMNSMLKDACIRFIRSQHPIAMSSKCLAKLYDIEEQKLKVLLMEDERMVWTRQNDLRDTFFSYAPYVYDPHKTRIYPGGETQ